MTTEIRLQQIEHPEVYNRYRWIASYENGLTCGCFDGHKSPEAAAACFRKRLGRSSEEIKARDLDAASDWSGTVP